MAKAIDLFPTEATTATSMRTRSGRALKTMKTDRASVDKKIETKKANRKTTISASSFDRARAETQGMIDEDDWTRCGARHVVALYDLMHVKIYGVEVAMTGSERHRSTLMAGGFVKREFSGDYTKAIEYFRWLWTREMGAEKWRRENGREGRRITVGLMLSGALLTDYRLYLSRKRSA